MTCVNCRPVAAFRIEPRRRIVDREAILQPREPNIETPLPPAFASRPAHVDRAAMRRVGASPIAVRFVVASGVMARRSIDTRRWPAFGRSARRASVRRSPGRVLRSTDRSPGAEAEVVIEAKAEADIEVARGPSGAPPPFAFALARCARPRRRDANASPSRHDDCR
ncbi:hypothetical protein QZM22_21940 [Burkholderia oklahomensis]|uniref:hypothetical protein n=1 Tax=Burkholderia oklahomensis TaxID=342113 RepID=UPI00264F5340|nr:hypothetical protein [Burkholderia oklahomensis]MDN7675108.1 hypothetical protein [Burkholderia oklahomensis]